MKRVLFISYYFPPAGGAGVQRTLKFIRYLPEFGILPIVLSVDPKSASYPVIQNEFLKEIPEEVEVHRTTSFEPLRFYKKISAQGEIPHSGFVNESNPGLIKKLSRFVRGNFFIPDARIGWNRFAFQKAKEIIEKYGIDTVFVSSPPHSSQLIGLELKRKLGVRFIADLRDPWTDIYYYKEFFHLPFARKMDAAYESDVLSESDHIITVGDSLKQLLFDKVKSADKNRFHVIENGYDEEDIKGIQKDRTDGRYRISYIGTLAESYNVTNFLETLKGIKNNSENIDLRLVGRIDKSVKAQIDDLGLNEIVTYVDFLPHKMAVQEMFDADLLLLAIPKIPANEGILTGKLFEYLATGNPILGIGPVNGDAAKILEKCSAGHMIDYDDKDGIQKTLLNHIKLHSDGSKSWKSDHSKIKEYSRRSQSQALAEILNNNE